MRVRVIALFWIVAACASCQREEASQASAAGAERAAKAPPRTDVTAAEQTKSASKSLLETKNIRIRPSGNGFYAVIDDIGKLDAILADIATLPPSTAKDGAIQEVIGKLAQTDSVRARELLKQWSNAKVSAWTGAAQEIARVMGKTDPAAAREFVLQEVPASLQIDVWAALMEVLPLDDQLAVFETLPEGRDKLQIAAPMINTWLTADPAAVAAWVDQYVAGRKDEELFYLGKPLRSSKSKENEDPVAWRAAFRAAATPEGRAFFAKNAVQHVKRAQRQEMLAEFAETLPDVKSRVPDRPWDTNPEAWAQTLSAENVAALSPEEADQFLRYWGQRNARKAFDWAVEHGRPEAGEALRLLYGKDPKEAVALAPKMPAGKDRDQALGSLCYHAALRGDETSIQALLPLISDPQFREQTREHVQRNMKPRSGGK